MDVYSIPQRKNFMVMMVHAMHPYDKRGNLLLQLNYHLCFYTLENVESINSLGCFESNAIINPSPIKFHNIH
jgi:hypothetical protein